MLFGKSKGQIGVDIGTSNIKIVQLIPKDNRFVLETYGIANVSYQISTKDSMKAIKETADILQNLIKKSRATSKRVVASIPNSVVFMSVIDMPKMEESELKTAVEFEAKKYVPLPLAEVALSWSLIEEKKGKITKETNLGSINNPHGTEKQKILITAVPTIVVDNYLKVFEKAGLELRALEIEALSLIRSLVGEADKTILLIDIGAKNTSINLVEDGYLRLSKNLSIGGDTVTTSIAQSLSVNFARAEQFKKDFGLSGTGEQMPQIMRPILDIIKSEAQKIIGLFESRGEKIDSVLLSGGAAKLPSLDGYFSALGKPVSLANPLNKIIYPEEIKPVIEPLGLNIGLALGLAMRPPHEK